MLNVHRKLTIHSIEMLNSEPETSTLALCSNQAITLAHILLLFGLKQAGSDESLLSLLLSLFRFQTAKKWQRCRHLNRWEFESCAPICIYLLPFTCLYITSMPKSPACVKPRRLKSAILFSRSVVRLAWLSKAGWNYMKLHVRASPTGKSSYFLGVCNQLLLQINSLYACIKRIWFDASI